MKRNTKRFALAAAALTLVAPLATTAASADPYNNHGGYNDHRNDNDRYGRADRNNRGDYNRGDYRGNGWNNQYERHSWRRGDRLSAYEQSRFRSFDYRREHYRDPPRGYRYVRDDRGDTLLVGVLSGVILGSIISNSQDHGYYDRGYGY